MSALYNMAILRLAADIPHHARLERPDASAERRSPICGSRVTIDVRIAPMDASPRSDRRSAPARSARPRPA